MNMGWTCPSCGVNWAPTVERCDCQGTQAIGVPLKPIPQPPLTTTYTGGGSGGFKGLLELGPMMTTIDTFYSDSSAANFTSANVITGVTNIAERWWKAKYPNFPEWGETA